MTTAAGAVDLAGLDVVHAAEVNLANGPWQALTISFEHFDLAGDRRRARAHVLLPPSLVNGDVERAPLLHVAGYEIATGVGALLLPWWAERQPVIVNPLTPTGEEAWPGDNALARGFNLDAALLHLARSLPFIDDARVAITGQSAGGYTSLMLASETFPLGGAAPDVAPIDMGFNARYLLLRNEVALAVDPGSELTPRPEVAAVVQQATQVLGSDFGSDLWWQHSPIGRLPWITAPVSLVMSSADLLVPIGQVGEEFVDGYDAAAFPPSLQLDPKVLMGSDRPRLLDLLPAENVEVHHVSVREGVPEIRIGTPVPPDQWLTLDIPHGSRQWNVVVVDEGPPEPWIDHIRFATLNARNSFFDRCYGDTPISVDQLTAAKLDALLDRFTGVEWAGGGIRHLDAPDVERADVIRGLRTYVAEGEEHARRFTSLYGQLPPERMALGGLAEAAAAVGAPTTSTS